MRAKTDFKDAYESVPVAEEQEIFHLPSWDSQFFEFLCLPFDLSSAPQTFMKQ